MTTKTKKQWSKNPNSGYPKPKPPRPVVIAYSGGVIQAIQVPRGIVVEVHNYDEAADKGCVAPRFEDGVGAKYVRQIYTSRS